jgi:hypothetical protein
MNRLPDTLQCRGANAIETVIETGSATESGSGIVIVSGNATEIIERKTADTIHTTNTVEATTTGGRTTEILAIRGLPGTQAITEIGNIETLLATIAMCVTCGTLGTLATEI